MKKMLLILLAMVFIFGTKVAMGEDWYIYSWGKCVNISVEEPNSVRNIFVGYKPDWIVRSPADFLKYGNERLMSSAKVINEVREGGKVVEVTIRLSSYNGNETWTFYRKQRCSLHDKAIEKEVERRKKVSDDYK